MNRYRVRVALRSIDPLATETVLLFCGGSVGGERPEADILYKYALDRGYDGPTILERQSLTTWQNIANAVAFLDQFDTIKVASNSLHADRARQYLWKQRPDVARRLTRGQDYRFGEIPHLKPVMAIRRMRDILRQRWTAR